MPRELLFIDLPKIMFESQDRASESSRFSIHLLTKIRLELQEVASEAFRLATDCLTTDNDQACGPWDC